MMPDASGLAANDDAPEHRIGVGVTARWSGPARRTARGKRRFVGGRAGMGEQPRRGRR